MNKQDEIENLEEKNKRLQEIIKEERKNREDKQTKTNIYLGIRFIQMICIGLAVFGGLWKGTEVMSLDTPEFLMVYGGLGAIISEIVARIFKKKIIK